MEPFNPKKLKHGPEWHIQEAIMARLKSMDWYVKRMIGNALQFGVPDLVAAKLERGTKWIEVKNPLAYSFTKAQQENFPKMAAAGMAVYVLFGASDGEINRLFKPPNGWEVMNLWGHGIKVAKLE